MRSNKLKHKILQKVLEYSKERNTTETEIL